MIAFSVPPPNHDDVDLTPAGPVMFGGVDATILADPGDEDRRPVILDIMDVMCAVDDVTTRWTRHETTARADRLIVRLLEEFADIMDTHRRAVDLLRQGVPR